jgi:hypothetical protein
MGEGLRVARAGLSPDLDLARLELGPQSLPLPNLHFVTGSEIACLRDGDDLQPASFRDTRRPS